MKRLLACLFLLHFAICSSQVSKEVERFITPFEKYERFNAMGRANDSISVLPDENHLKLE